MSLDIRPAQDMADIQDLRRLRNGVRSFMTHNTNEISKVEQVAWYKETYLPANEANEMHAFLGCEGDRPVGYGLITKRDDRYWLSGGIEEGHRGQGYGHDIFEYIANYVLENCAEVVWLDVLETNLPAISLYETLGFEETEYHDGTIVMKLERGDD